MSKHCRCMVVGMLLCLTFVVVSGQAPKREFRAAWVASVTNLDWPTSNSLSVQAQKDQLVSLLTALRANGISAVIFQVRPECDAFYDSPYEPWSYWLTGSQGTPPNPYYDPLEFAVSEAHRRGMEIHAWFNPYRAERVAGNYATAPNHVTNLHPDWVLSFLVGGTSPYTLKMLDPGLPGVREYDAKVIADVVRRYDVDGIHMDDYFYPYSPKITVQDSTSWRLYGGEFSNIDDWRRNNVNLLVKMLHDSIQAIKPYAKFGISPFGIWKNGYPPGIWGLNSYSEIYCDPIAWLQQGTIDYLTPQLYWKIGGGQDYQSLSAWWADSVAAHGKHFYPGKAAYHVSDGSFSAGEMPNQIKIDRGNPKTGGTVFFRARVGINDNPKGFADSLRNNFYRYLALHPVMQWKDVVPPYPPRAIRLAPLAGTGVSAIQWDLPLTAPDGDSASRYAVYRFDHRPAGDEFADPRNLISIEGQRYTIPSPIGTPGPVYFAVTALDRNYNESDTSNILLVTPPPSPLLAWPADGATALPESVTVRWHAQAGVTSYHLQVGNDPTFATGIMVNDSTLTDTMRVVRGLDGQTAYSWRVRSANMAGRGPFASPFTFVTGTPRAPEKIFPPAATPNLPVNLTFVWHSSLAATSYQFQLARTSDYSDLATDSSGVVDTTATVTGLDYYRIYFWRVRARNAIGASPWSPSSNFRTYTGVELTQNDGLPSEFLLSQNYPNPFNPTTSLQFALPRTEHVTLRVYDMLGREESTLVDEVLPAGTYTVTWNASRAASGMYFCRMTAGSFVATKRMLLLK